MNWVYALLLAAAALTVIRIYTVVKRGVDERSSDWDEQLVKNLRARGGTGFQAYDIDFFFGVPTMAACEQLAALLRADGCEVDFREATTEGASGFTLAAHKQMRVSVPEMQAHSRRYREFAKRCEAAYDGWATEGITQKAQDNVRLRPKTLPRRFS